MESKPDFRRIESEALLLVRDHILLCDSVLQSFDYSSGPLHEMREKTEQLLRSMGVEPPDGSCGEFLERMEAKRL